jgi:hypothetical protein
MGFEIYFEVLNCIYVNVGKEFLKLKIRSYKSPEIIYDSYFVDFKLT